MNKDLSVLVNARIESSRLKYKMIRPFGDSCLLRIALEKLNALSFAKHRFLCIAEDELLPYAEGLQNIEIMRREKKSVTKGDVGAVCFKHYYDIPTPWFMFMNACHPFVSIDTYFNAFEDFSKTDYNAYTSVTRKKIWLFDHEGEPLTNKDPKVLSTKAGNYSLEANHAFHIISKEFFSKTGFLHWEMKKGSPHGIEIPDFEALDIDSPLDFNICESLYKANYPEDYLKEKPFTPDLDKGSLKPASINKKSNAFQIGKFSFPDTNKTLIIAEAGCAHEGSLGLAHQFIEVAAECEVDVIKFQTHIADAESTLEEPFRIPISDQYKTRYDYWKRMEFTESQWIELKNHAEEKGLVFMSSPFSCEAVDLLSRIGVPAWKIGSGEITNKLMLRHMAKTGLPVILSTGLGFYKEIDETVKFFQEQDIPLALLQCSSIYPCPPELAGLNNIEELKERYGLPVGFSNHSPTISQCMASICFGAQMIEFHLTLSDKMFGPDVKSSLTPDKVKELVQHIRVIDIIKSSSTNKDVVAYDLKSMRDIFFKSLILKEDVKAGTPLTENILTAKKPGTGIDVSKIDEIVGKKTNRDMKKGEFLKLDDLQS